jgi:hypothetical protein
MPVSVGSLVSNALRGLIRDSDVEDSAKRRRLLRERLRRQRELDQRRRLGRQRKLMQSRHLAPSYQQRAAFMTAELRMLDIIGIKKGKIKL